MRVVVEEGLLYPCSCIIVQDGFGTANTALAFHNKQLLALLETDLPYAVQSSS